MKRTIFAMAMLITTSLYSQEGLFTLFGADYHQVHFIDDNNGWLVADGFVMSTSNQGLTWKVILSTGGGKFEGEDSQENYIGAQSRPDSYVFIDSKVFDKSNIWILALYNKDYENCILKTRDGGATWKKYPVTFSTTLTRVGGCKTIFINNMVGFLAIQSRLYKTTDGGITWTENTVLQNRSIQDYCFTDENNGWYVGGTYNDGSGSHTLVAHTTDGGKTWNDIPNSFTESSQSIFVGQGSIWVGVIASGAGSLLKITENYTKWEKISSGIKFGVLHFFDDKNGFTNEKGSGTTTGRLNTYKTTDGGVNWKKISDYAQDSYYSPNLFWIIQQNGLMKYENGGEKQSLNIIGAKTHTLTDFAIVSPEVIVGVGTYGSIIRSTDGGTTWTTVFDFYNGHPNVRINQIEFFDENNGLFLANEGGADGEARGNVWRTTDKGASWTQCPTDVIAGAMEIVDGRCYLFSGNVVRISDNYGQDWHILTTTIPEAFVIKAFFTTKLCGYVILSPKIYPANNILARTTDGGNSWTEILKTDYLSNNEMYFTSDKVGFLGDLGRHQLHKTVDAGNTWNLIYDLKTGLSPDGSFYFLNEKEGFAAREGLFKTVDSGLNWHLISTKRGFGLKFSSSGTGYEIISQAVLSGTKPVGQVLNGGTTIEEPKVILEQNFDGETFPPAGWKLETTNTNATWQRGNVKDLSFNSVDPTNVASALCPWIDGDQFEILCSPKFSLTGSQSALEFYAGFSTGYLTNATVALLISNDEQNFKELWRCQNDGKDWLFRKIQVDLSSYRNIENLVLYWTYFGRNGDVFALDNISLTDLISGTSRYTTTSNLSLNLFNSPNPFSGSTVLNYAIDEPSPVEIRVYDLCGKLVYNLDQKMAPAGWNQLRMELNEIGNPGIYLLKLQVGQHIGTLRLIKH